MRDFRQELEGVPCWGPSTEELFRTTGVPSQDTILQNREELIGLCEFMEREQVRSYLEIGTWSGQMVTTLHRLFRFDSVAAADIGWAQSIGLPLHLPDEADLFEGDSHSEDYRRWRHRLGPIDLVLIDGDHSYEGVRLDFETNRRFPHRFLAFHDIVNPHPLAPGPKKLWAELEGTKVEIVRPHQELGLDHSTMGIGIWSSL